MSQPALTFDEQTKPTCTSHPLQSTAMPTPPISTGLLGKLPKEIRDMIYKRVLGAVTRNGNLHHSSARNTTAITRVSKYFHEDTKRALKKHGVYRLHIEHKGGRYRSHPSFPSDQVLGNIGNLSIDVELANPIRINGSEIFGILQDLVEVMQHHRHCYIEVVRPKFGSFVTQELAGFEVLRKFKYLTVELSRYEPNSKEGFSRPLYIEYLVEAEGRKMAVATIKSLLRLDESLENSPELRLIETVWHSRYQEVPFKCPPDEDSLHDMRIMDVA